jgi:DNA-binding LacI/PurR family transcriptional regulator
MMKALQHSKEVRAFSRDCAKTLLRGNHPPFELEGIGMAQKRVGLKQIAELAGMSMGNVSMVLSGRGDEARISKASQQRILDAAKELQYKPNVYAKRLRMQNASRLIIAVFFAPTRHVAVVGSFFAGIHDLLAGDKDDMKPEIVLYPYTQGQLRDADEQIHQTCFNGAVFMGMSTDDMNYLESLEIPAPIVLFNRVSAHHHYVYADNANIGEIAARVFAQKGLHNVYLVTGRNVSVAGEEREQGFINGCQRLALHLPETHVLRVSNRYEGGKEAAQLIPDGPDMPDAIFFSEGLMGASALHELQVRGFRIPEQISLLCYSGGSSEGYTIPTLSTIQMPMEEMSRDCLVLLQQAIQHPERGQMSITHKPILEIRESIVI